MSTGSVKCLVNCRLRLSNFGDKFKQWKKKEEKKKKKKSKGGIERSNPFVFGWGVHSGKLGNFNLVWRLVVDCYLDSQTNEKRKRKKRTREKIVFKFPLEKSFLFVSFRKSRLWLETCQMITTSLPQHTKTKNKTKHKTKNKHGRQKQYNKR